jgi:hypothetical protein
MEVDDATIDILGSQLQCLRNTGARVVEQRE